MDSGMAGARSKNENCSLDIICDLDRDPFSDWVFTLVLKKKVDSNLKFSLNRGVHKFSIVHQQLKKHFFDP